MPSTSLNKMNVALPTATDVSKILMPKLKYRFRAEFNNFGGADDSTVLTRQIIDFKRPSGNFVITEMPTYNSIVKIAGKPKFDNVSCKLRDDATNQVSNLVEAQMAKQFDFENQASAADSNDYKFTIRLDMLDGGNGTREVGEKETWMFYGCYIKKASYGDLAYSDSGVLEISLEFRFDNAVQVDENDEVVTDGGFGTSPNAIDSSNNSTSS